MRPCRSGSPTCRPSCTPARPIPGFAATEATEAESLRLYTDMLARHTRQFIAAPFRDWNDAISHLFGSFSARPTVVGSGTVDDPVNRTQIEWSETIGHRHLQRLATARDIAAAD